MSIRCFGCGKFISSAQIDVGKAKFFYTPLSEFSEERCDWKCASCCLLQTTENSNLQKGDHE